MMVIVCRIVALEGCLRVHEPDGRGTNWNSCSRIALILFSLERNARWIREKDFESSFMFAVSAGDAEDEEPACRRDHHEEEEE
jgi:hypothetical protein